jgi:hypothetical protein
MSDLNRMQVEDEWSSSEESEEQKDYLIYHVDPKLMNKCEKMMKIDYEPLALKKTIDAWFDEPGRDVKEDKWILRHKTMECRIWTCEDGLAIDPDLPMIQCEMYFPEVNDPAIIHEALALRRKFDTA